MDAGPQTFSDHPTPASSAADQVRGRRPTDTSTPRYLPSVGPAGLEPATNGL